MTAREEERRVQGPPVTEGSALELESLATKVAEIRNRLERLEEALRKKVLSVDSPGRHVRVRINGMEEIVELTIAPAALRDPQIHNLGASVLATVGAACSRASKLRQTARAKVFADLTDVGTTGVPASRGGST
jgi:DNA-binding protein YbaB